MFEKPRVFHGTPTEFEGERALPKRQQRFDVLESGERVFKFDEESFHATPREWIALAYTYKNKIIEDHDVKLQYNMGVNLHEEDMTVTVHGVGSLEETLEQMYGDGGYLYHFDSDKFFYMEGLGDLEVISTEEVGALEVERVDDPVSRMRELGVKFRFIDLDQS